MRLATSTFSACLALALLAGCSQPKDKSGDAGASEVAATVDGQKITVGQIDTELKASGIADPTAPNMRQAALAATVAAICLAAAEVAATCSDFPAGSRSPPFASTCRARR